MPADKGPAPNEASEIAAAIAKDTIETQQRKVRGRKSKTSDHQEAVIRISELNPLAIETLIADLKHAQDAGTIFAEGIKAFSEKAGIQASVLRKFIVARAGEAFQDKKRDAQQLALLFEEIGE